MSSAAVAASRRSAWPFGPVLDAAELALPPCRLGGSFRNPSDELRRAAGVSEACSAPLIRLACSWIFSGPAASMILPPKAASSMIAKLRSRYSSTAAHWTPRRAELCRVIMALGVMGQALTAIAQVDQQRAQEYFKVAQGVCRSPCGAMTQSPETDGPSRSRRAGSCVKERGGVTTKLSGRNHDP